MNEYIPLANPGNWFFDPLPKGKKPFAHLIVNARRSETPGGSECTDYTARCGKLAFEFVMDCTPFTVFCKTLEEAIAKGAVRCPECI